MPDPVDHSEFEPGRDVLIARAALARLQADPDLAAYLAGGTGLLLIESEDLFDLSGYKAPALAIVLGSVDEETTGNQQTNTLTVELTLTLFTAGTSGQDGQLLRARILERCKRELSRQWGQLFDENNLPLNLDVGFRRLALTPRRKADNVLLTTMVVAYRATISRSAYL